MSYADIPLIDIPVEQRDAVGNFFEKGAMVREGSQLQGNCYIGAYSAINGATLYPRTSIGAYCSIARNAAIGAPHHPLGCLGTSLALGGTLAALELHETRLGNDVWVGANAVILANTVIGDGAVIGGGAVVTRDVEPFAIMVGVPARRIRFRFSSEICTQLLDVRWWELEHGRINTLPHANIEECIRILKEWRARNERHTT